MSEISSENSLRNAIVTLERKRDADGARLKEQFFVTFESIKPLNMLRSSFKEAIEPGEFKTHLLTKAVGIGAGLLSKMMFQRLTKNPVKRMLGTALMFGVANLVANNPGVVESLGRGFMKIVRGTQR